MPDFLSLNAFLEKYKLASQNKSKDVRFTLDELTGIAHDVHALMSCALETQQTHSELKTLLKDVLEELKALGSDGADGGTF
jgi:hypothetical protein